VLLTRGTNREELFFAFLTRGTNREELFSRF